MSTVGGVSTEELKNIINELERLEEQKKEINEEVREILKDSKAHGLSPAIIKKILKLRSLAPEKRAEEEFLLQLYQAALEDFPLFKEGGVSCK